MECPKAALFDLDETLAASFESPSDEIVAKLLKVLERVPTAIITGRDFAWMNKDFLPRVVKSAPPNRFFVLAEGAAQCEVWDGSAWKELYGDSLPEKDRARIEKAIRESVTETRALEGLPVYGEQFVHRRAAVAFASLGWQVPREMRKTWDPENKRRSALRDAIVKKLPEFDVLMGGATTIDVTKKGVNKARGVRWLAEHLKCTPQEMVYVGDALFPGGNDYVVIATDIHVRATSGPAETLKIIDELLAVCNI